MGMGKGKGTLTDPSPDAGAVIPDPASCAPWTDTIDPGAGLRCEQEPPPDPGPFGGRIALTFDDGPNPSTTPQIVAILREQHIPATFFMGGQQLEDPAARAIALDIHRDPLFRVANHTYTHPEMPTLSLVDAQAQIEDTTAALQAAIGDPCYFPRFFRFPFSRASCETVRLVRERGFAVTGVHIDPVDWCYAMDNGHCSEANVPWMPAEYRDDMVSWVLTQLDRYQGGIVLMHDIHPNTVAMLPLVIDALRGAGMSFVALDDASVFPLLNGEVDPPEPPACCAGITR
jgi:peptidoglycan/xylan/chitin deacetylase (PgdA/CDA1 family)